MRKLVLAIVVVSLALGAAACGADEEPAAEPAPPPAAEPAPPPAEEPPAEQPPAEEPPAEEPPAEEPPAEAPDECATESLPLKTPGQLTISTGNPAFDPWFSGGTETDDWEFNDPHNGQGFEGAFAYALAERLGFTDDQVEWVAIPFLKAFAPGAKDFDFGLQQISYKKKRDKNVDFSVSYFDLNQALVSYAGSPIDGATSFADLKSAKFGVPVGTTSYDYVVENVQPDTEPKVYDDLTGAVQALKNKQVDGVVVDLPTAFFLVAVEVEKGIIVGQFPTIGEEERFGLVFEEGSPLLACVNTAIEEMRADGTLQGIYDEWLAGSDQAPFISQ